MKRFISMLVLVAVSAVAQTQRPITFDDMMAVRRVGAPRVSPDGKWLAYDVSTIDYPKNIRKSAVYLMPASGGMPLQISDGVKQDENPVWSPDGKTLAYVSNRETAAKQIYLYDVTSKATRKLSNLPGGASTLVWSPTGSGLAFVSDIYVDCGVAVDCAQKKSAAEEGSIVKARVIDTLLYRHWNQWQPTTRSHVLFQPIDGSTPRDMTPGNFDAPPFSVGGGDSFDISPDGRELVYASNTDDHLETSTNTDLFLVPLTGGEARRISTSKGADDYPVYSPDGTWIAFRSQERAGFEADRWRLMLYNRRAGTITEIAADFADQVDEIRFTPDSRSIVFTAAEKAHVAIFEVPAAPGGKVRRLYNAGSASAINISRDGKNIYFDRSSIMRPNEIYVVERSSGKARQLSRENDALFEKLALGEVTETWYAGAGGTRVHGFVVKPPMFDASKKYPGIVLIHGGPQSAWNDSWSFRWNPQMFASRGYALFIPNARGSTGFGQQFVDEVSRDWGGRAYEDIMKGVDEFAKAPFVDSSRLGAAGASYGGYMINWILGHSDRFKALVSHDGVYNLESMAGVTEELWFTDWEFGGDPVDNPEDYAKWSPHRFAKNFKTPTLVIHGELDYRVPVGEGMQLFTALQRRGVPSKFLYFPDEGHWVLKPQNSALWHQTVLGWMDQWLKP